MKRFPLSTLRGHISAPRSNFDMVDTDSESSHQALFIQTKFASDLSECILNHVVNQRNRLRYKGLDKNFQLAGLGFILLDYPTKIV